MLEELLIDNTVIDAGHYSLLRGPSALDLFLWEEGVKLYVSAKKQGLEHIGLYVMVDDVHGISEVAKKNGLSGNVFRRKLNFEQLPDSYLQILNAYNLVMSEVSVFSQDKLREKGRQLNRQRKMPRKGKPCLRIVGAFDYIKQREGFTNSICFYDALKTEDGFKLMSGSNYARNFFGTTLRVYYRIFSDRETYHDIKSQ